MRTAEIQDGAIATADIGNNVINGSKVFNNSITHSDILGANTSGSVNLSGVPVGRCSSVNFSVSGAQPGQVAVFNFLEDPPAGVTVHALGVFTAGTVRAAVCNFTGGSFPALVDFPVRIMTFG